MIQKNENNFGFGTKILFTILIVFASSFFLSCSTSSKNQETTMFPQVPNRKPANVEIKKGCLKGYVRCDFSCGARLCCPEQFLQHNPKVILNRGQCPQQHIPCGGGGCCMIPSSYCLTELHDPSCEPRFGPSGNYSVIRYPEGSLSKDQICKDGVWEVRYKCTQGQIPCGIDSCCDPVSDDNQEGRSHQ